MVNEPVEIALAQLDFSPAYLDLVSFQSKIGKNDFNAQGKLTNYFLMYLRTKFWLVT